MAEGKPTLPLIHVMQHGTQAQSMLVRSAIENGGREDFTDVLAAIHATDALAVTKQYAVREAQAAKEGLALLPPSIFADSLQELCEFAIARKY